MDSVGPDLRERISAVCEAQPHVELAIVFGSVAKGTATDRSDVDIAVRGRGIEMLSLTLALSEALGREVDVVMLDDPGVPLLEALIRDGIVIWESAPGAGAQWRSTVLAMLETDRPWYARMRDSWLRHVASEGL
ncbi:MAG: nucleotidyltransferase domain-containing protein [Polyangiaceae bacterium]